jgi:prepilin-type N-terminal cleavage/methylation domain-containing protein
MLKQYKTKDQKGFTIIEVLIVLAIAGLILLIVFLAVPALQRNSRNTQRKTDIGRIGSAATTVVANSNGNVATGMTRANLVAEVGNNLSIYDFSVAANLVVNVEASGGTQAAVTNKDVVDVEGNAKCNGTAAQYSSRQVAVLYAVEAGNGTTSICVDQ